jgi:hypothetical protein
LLEKLRQFVFLHVSSELNGGALMLFFHGGDIAMRLRMVASCDDEPGVRKRLAHNSESVNHQFEPLVSSPFSKCENAVLRISAA